MFIDHRGTRILRIDATSGSARHLRAVWDEAEALTAVATPNSLRVLLVLRAVPGKGTPEDLARRMLAHGDKVLATAVVGTPFWKIVIAGVRASGRNNVEFFEDADAALQWLVAR